MDWMNGRSWEDIMLEFLHDRRLRTEYKVVGDGNKHVEDAEVISIETIKKDSK